MKMIKVHGYRCSPITGMVRACFHEKKVDYEFVNVDFCTAAHKKPAFLALNPFGQMPAIQDGDFTLFESRAIIRYLAKKYEGQGVNLLGNTLREQAVVEQWCQVESQSFLPPCSAIVRSIVRASTGGNSTEKGVDAINLENLNKVLDIYEERLSKSEYLAGNFFSLADLQHLPSTHYLVNVAGMEHFITSRSHVNGWWKNICSRPSWNKLAHIMKS